MARSAISGFNAILISHFKRHMWPVAFTTILIRLLGQMWFVALQTGEVFTMPVMTFLAIED